MGSQAVIHSIRFHLDHIPDFSDLIDTHDDGLSDLFEIERRENTHKDNQIIAHLALQVPQVTIPAGAEGSDDCIAKKLGAFGRRRG
jgi:hypothetical protein